MSKTQTALAAFVASVLASATSATYSYSFFAVAFGIIAIAFGIATIVVLTLATE